jgi:hypothetical protein
MYVAYLDDSREVHPPVFVLAGYISTAKAWELFSAEWSAALLEQPTIQYLKMSEAASPPSGQFEGVRPEFINYKLKRLYEIIEKYVLGNFQ